VDDHLQSGFWLRGVVLPSSRRGGFFGGHLHRLGGFYGSLLSSRCHVFYGHRRRDLVSLGLGTCRQKTSVSVNMATTTTLRRHFDFSRVLTFNYAGLRQRSLSSQRFGFRLRGGSGLLSRRRGFFFLHCCSRFIPLPGQIRRFPAEYTSRLSI
jgi:hypothetical protein